MNKPVSAFLSYFQTPSPAWLAALASRVALAVPTAQAAWLLGHCTDYLVPDGLAT